MTIGGDIKSTLTLDVSKFTSSVEKATNNLDSLDKKLSAVSKAADTVEKVVSKLGSDVSGASDRFKSLDKALESLVQHLNKTLVDGFKSTGEASRKASKEVDALASSTDKAGKGMLSFADWTKRYGAAVESLKPSLQRVTESQKELTRAQEETARATKKSATEGIQAKLQVLESERATNDKIIAEKRKLASELAAIEAKIRNESLSHKAAADQYLNRLGVVGGKNKIAAELAEATRLDNNADFIRKQYQETLRLNQALVEKNVLTLKSIDALEKEYATAVASERARATNAKLAVERLREYNVAQKRMETERREQIRMTAEFERQQAAQTMQAMRGMGQLWGASKVEAGLGQVVEKSASAQDIQLRVRAWGIRGAELEEFNKKAFDLARQEDYLSNLDAIQGRFTAIASIGHNDAKIVDATVAQSLQTVQALRTLGYETGSVTDVQRNLYGIAETRQVMNDSNAINKTFDTAFRMVNVSGGKITLADIETVLRNLGPGANQISDAGLMNIVALAEQAKVAGGHNSGSAGAGVSSVGTMIKMAQLYAMGKPISNTLLEQMAGAGLTAGNFESLEKVSGGKAEHTAMLRAMKSAGLKNQQEIMSDPVTALWKMRDPIIKYMSESAKNRELYFGDAGADTGNEEMQRNALQKFWSRSGLSNKAIAQMVTAQDPRYHERAVHVSESAMSGENAKKTLDMAKEAGNWNLAVQEMKKGAESLASAFEPVLKQLSFIPRAIGSVLSAAGDFARNNPMIATAALATTAVVGLRMAWAGMANTFGFVSGLSGALKNLAAGAQGANTAAARASTSWFSFGKSATEATSPTLRSAMAAERAAEKARVLAVENLNAARAYTATQTGMARLSAVQNTLLPAQARAAEATKAHAAAVANVATASNTATVAQRAMAAGSRLASGALSLIGGPLGLIAIALTAGAMLWSKWADAAETSATRAVRAAETAEQKLKKLREEKTYGVGQLGEERKTLAELEDLLNFKIQARASDLPEFRAKVEKQRELVDELENREKESSKPSATSGEKPGKPGKTGSSSVSSFLNTDGRHVREFEDSFARQFMSADARANIEQLKLDALISGNASYTDQARQEVIKLWAGGDLDDGKDPTKRRFLKGAAYDKNGVASVDGKGYDKLNPWGVDQMDWSAKVSIGGGQSRSLTDLMEEIARRKELADIIKATTFASERQRELDTESSMAMEELTGKTDGQTDAMKALTREFERLSARTPGMSDDVKLGNDKAKALTSRATIDYVNEAISLKQKNADMSAQFADTEIERIRLSQDAFIAAETKKVNAYRDSLNAQIADLERRGMQESDEYRKAIKARELSEEQFTTYLKNIAKQREDALLTPIQRMAKEWKDVYKQVGQLEENWANSFLENLNTSLNGGKADWSSYLRGIASDISKMALKSLFGDQIKGMFSGLGNAVKGALGSEASTGQAAGQSVGSDKSFWDRAIEGVKGFWGSLTGATDATKKMSSGVESVVANAAEEVTSKAISTTANQTATSALGALTASANAAANALANVAASGGGGGVGGMLGGLFGGSDSFIGTGSESWASISDWSQFAFADGGVMTSIGPVALRKYAAGGVARTPQLAMYGEGSMPEAFVPLPDGRSIPVTIQGGRFNDSSAPAAAPAVTVNVINQTGQSVEAKQTQRFDGRQMILDVVLSAASQPGQFRDGMRGAMA